MSKKIFAILMITLLLVGCSKTPKEETLSNLEKVQNQLYAMENYACTATLTRVSNKGENVYDTKQYYKISGEYRIEITGPEKVKGNVTIFDGTMVSQYNPQIEGKIAIDVPASAARDEMFLGNFLKNYEAAQQSDEANVATANVDGAQTTVLEATVPGDHPYLATEKLWMDNETLTPVKLAIYDTDGKERVIVEFRDFQYNVDMNEELFSIKVVE